MARRGEHSLIEIRTMVLNAAEVIVKEEGLSQLTIRKIALEIGYTVGSIYMVFTNMNDLIMHLKAQTLTAIYEQLQQPENHDLEMMATAYLAYARLNFNLWSLIFEHRLPENAKIPGWYEEKVNAMVTPIEAQLAKLAPKSSRVHQEQAAKVLLASLHGVCLWFLTHSPAAKSEAQEAVVLLVRNFLKGWNDESNSYSSVLGKCKVTKKVAISTSKPNIDNAKPGST